MTYLLTPTLFILALLFTISPATPPDCKQKAPSRADLEQMFGQAVDCETPKIVMDRSGKQIENPEPKGLVCFISDYHYMRIKIKVEFNSSQYAKRIFIFDSTNYSAAYKAGDQIVMLNGRGKFLKKIEKLSEGDCKTNFVEEYQDLSMEYYSINCQNSMPGGVTITWKE